MNDTVAELECPFCGGRQLKLEAQDSALWVSCGDCHSVGPMAHSTHEAIARWGWLYADVSQYRHLPDRSRK